MSQDTTPPVDWAALPLFPLQTVLFPGGLLQLKVFEARYVDLVSRCLKSGEAFGVVAIIRGSEVNPPQGEAGIEFESVGCLAQIIEVDSETPGILQVKCKGLTRFAIEHASRADDGLWLGRSVGQPADPRVLPSREQVATAQALSSAITALKTRGVNPFLEPFDFQDAGWIANRWCELLPISLAARQRLMALDDPAVRLQLVDQFLRQKGIVNEG